MTKRQSNRNPAPTEQGERPTAVVARRQDKMSEIVAREIVHDIVARGLEPGAKLPPEGAMLQEFGVGRATLREALRILEVHGLIFIRPGPGGGPVVAQASPSNFGRISSLYYHMKRATFRELAEARLAMEPLMARLAAERQDPEMMDRLNASIEDAREAIVEDDRTWARVSTDFHGIVSGLSGNRILDLFGESLKELWFDRVMGATYPAPSRERVRKDHEDIARAISRGDPRKAEALMRKHLEEFVTFSAKRHPGMWHEIVDWR